ncbi:hypothetical protein EYF80_045398 [Liparis tanakae]|uniref:Uncharacterized protein n=1 Tax=Liparis tanakae TaxID=230148 RepID=A0A4Z2FU91_9TELE|nr:hypothetical protein EYF80_045398 [Liparis tanakae]
MDGGGRDGWREEVGMDGGRRSGWMDGGGGGRMEGFHLSLQYVTKLELRNKRSYFKLNLVVSIGAAVIRMNPFPGSVLEAAESSSGADCVGGGAVREGRPANQELTHSGLHRLMEMDLTLWDMCCVVTVAERLLTCPQGLQAREQVSPRGCCRPPGDRRSSKIVKQLRPCCGAHADALSGPGSAVLFMHRHSNNLIPHTGRRFSAPAL